MDTDIAREIERARDAAQHRDRKTARAILRKVLEQQPRNLEGWLLFAEVAKKDAHTIHCLEHVLKIDPDNERARQWLASLYAPSQSYLVRVQRKAEADPLWVLHQLREEVSRQPASEPEFAEETAGDFGPFAYADDGARRSLPGKARYANSLSSGKLEMALLAVTSILLVCMLAGLGLALLSARARFQQQAQALAEITAVLDENLRALNAEDLPAVMATIHPDSPAYQDIEEEARQAFQTYDLSYELSGVQVIARSDQEVRLRFIQVTRKLRGPDFQDQRVTGVVILRLDQGAWKIYEKQIETTEILN